MKKNNLISFIILIIGVISLTVGVTLSFQSSNQTNPAEDKGTLKNPVETPLPETTPNEDNPQVEPTPNESIETPITPTEPPLEPTTNFQNEAEVISYFSNQEAYLKTAQVNQENPTIRERIKNGFVTVVDFLFYDKEIGGYTFKQLTNSAKLQVIKIALSIDHKIDEYFPNYKDSIKKGYETVKEKLAELYLKTTSSLCETVGEDTCNQAKEDFETMKESFGFTFDLLKDLGSDLAGTVKDWYESFRNK